MARGYRHIQEYEKEIQEVHRCRHAVPCQAASLPFSVIVSHEAQKVKILKKLLLVSTFEKRKEGCAEK